MMDGKQVKMAFVGRAPRFSPHCVEKDAAVLAAVRSRLSSGGFLCGDVLTEDMTGKLPEADVYLSMARSRQMLRLLAECEQRGRLVVNSVAGVTRCGQRKQLMEQLCQQGIAVPPLVGRDGYWVKRGSGTAETPSDVQYAADRDTAMKLAEAMKARGVEEVEVRAHVTGDLVKFYGVRHTDFFRYYYPVEDGDWKFGDEQHNGRAHHYAFDGKALQTMAFRAAAYAGVEVFGGDCIIRPDGTPVLIDLNDWPSFSRCREDAAQAIARMVALKIER